MGYLHVPLAALVEYFWYLVCQNTLIAIHIAPVQPAERAVSVRSRYRSTELKYAQYILTDVLSNSMGRIYLDHIGGSRLFSCAACDTVLTNRNELISTRFTGATGRAFLFNKVVNLNYSEVQDRVMLTGRHMVRDVSCKNCDAKLGWIYEFATEENQRYKEGKVILERALVTETDGMEERMGEENN